VRIRIRVGVRVGARVRDRVRVGVTVCRCSLTLHNYSQLELLDCLYQVARTYQPGCYPQQA
jgi:hypothetical protein